MLKRLAFSLFLFSGFIASAQNIIFDAKGLLFLTDADMSAFSIMDGNLRKMEDSKDVISTLEFPLDYGDPGQIKTDKASNSIFKEAKNICFTSDQKLAYVLETKGETAYDDTSFEDIEEEFPAGRYVTVIDVTDLKKPKSLYRFPVGRNPSAISIDPSDKYLAIATEEYGKEIQLYELDNSGKPVRVIKKPSGLPPGRIVEIKWHSSGNFLIYLNQDEADLGIIEVHRDGPTQQIIRLELYGDPVKIGGMPTKGEFTPDEKYFIALDKKKYKTDMEDRSKGELFVIKLNLEDRETNHYLISKAEVGENPCNFDIHPSGNYIVVNNLEHSFMPPEHYMDDGESSLTVLSLSFDGILESIKTQKIDGILPSSAIFDKNGQNLAVSIFQYLTFGYSFGGIEFYKFDPNAKSVLELQKGKIYVPRGAHSLKAIMEY
ncbi:YncE family protein [Jiulongibacter sediminis]|jgi:DNA-binding beta-propeller fold protein YncE|uniref:YncE family protein n=1 Tax=Jiulongibacter sediminis TaxID=1605367 RepID=UPI0026F31C9C|nr:hypothetical protein [Jiulongibacter sediminis]